MCVRGIVACVCARDSSMKRVTRDGSMKRVVAIVASSDSVHTHTHVSPSIMTPQSIPIRMYRPLS